ncbi:MAG: nucleolar RNA-binding Nop10p family protein [Nanoarchaeota archaeon]
MAEHIRKCPAEGTYTLEKKCSCGAETVVPRPPKFSLKDKYAPLRREIKREELKKKMLY